MLHTDASSVAIGAILSQSNSQGEEHPVSYLSQTLNKHERNYSTTKWECLAVLYAIKECRPYIHSVKFTVATDRSSLTWLQTMKDPERQLAHWATKFLSYNFDIIHCPGSKHGNADALYRLPLIGVIGPNLDSVYKLITHPDQWKTLPSNTVQTLEQMAHNTVMKD